MLFVRQQTLDRWVEQLKQTVYEVDGTDYSFIDPYIRNKRFVVLGESSHGVGDYQRMRIALIHYLQQQHGFAGEPPN
ncbi:hypothetical protein [Numidum massiliense]|uniref:hypothetical protein n=1 Tax=Numidum massiliense TaxID=1522315 RepID=UPI0006D54EF9|nr:hypothetical protein [Numidum massiliense]